MAVVRKAFAIDPSSPFVFPSAHVKNQSMETRAITRAFARICTRAKIPQGSPHDVRRTGATTLTGRYGVGRFIVGLVLGHTPHDGAAVTAVYDRHTYLPEKRAALIDWEGHLTGATQTLSPVGAPPRLLSVSLEASKSEARDLVNQGDLHQAVLIMGMSLARCAKSSDLHQDILARAGLQLAKRGATEEVVRWIDGF